MTQAPNKLIWYELITTDQDVAESLLPRRRRLEHGRYSTIYLIQGLTGQLDMWRNRPPLRKNFPELADELFAKGEAPPCILVWVDCWTSLRRKPVPRLTATGRYHTYLCEEIGVWIVSHYGTLPTRDHRAIAGKSSGGYGAMVTPMLRPDLRLFRRAPSPTMPRLS